MFRLFRSYVFLGSGGVICGTLAGEETTMESRISIDGAVFGRCKAPSIWILSLGLEVVPTPLIVSLVGIVSFFDFFFVGLASSSLTRLFLEAEPRGTGTSDALTGSIFPYSS